MNDAVKLAQGLGRLLGSIGGRDNVYYRHTNDPTAPLAYVHYRDERFDAPGSIIYGAAAPGLYWVDSWHLPATTSHAASLEARKSFGLSAESMPTAQVCEAMLRIVYDNPALRLVAIRGYADPDSGYGHYVYGYQID